MAYQVEVTDTFGGEANYCWVRRYTLPTMPAHMSHLQERAWLVRQAKKMAGYTGVRGTTADLGDLIEWRPAGVCHVMFISWQDD